MNKLAVVLAKIALTIVIVIVALVLALIGMLIFATGVLWRILRIVLMAAGIVVTGYLLVGIASTIFLLAFWRQYRKSGRPIYFKMRE